MSAPISPLPVKGGARDELPAYVSNGVVGLRVREMPLAGGLTVISGYTGEHPQRRIEAMAVAPYPVGGDIQVAGVWLSDSPHAVNVIDQVYDFATGELRSRFEFTADDCKASIEVLIFCSRDEPSLVCQDIALKVNRAIDVSLKSLIDGRSVPGRAVRHLRDTPGEDKPSCDGAALWESAGALSTCGIAYVTEITGCKAESDKPPLENRTLVTRYDFKATAGKIYHLRQIASVVPSVTHAQPDFQAVRQVALARKKGFDAIRSANRAAWRDLWKGRIVIKGADRLWQKLADAALFYLFSSTHVASPASTSIFGLASWHDYHYYFGHVMWDIETFVVPVLSLLQPNVAESLLDYRSRNLAGASSNARMRGRRGLQFPWESAPSTGQECAPMPGSASWHEDHVSLDVARAFAVHASITGDVEYLREKAWPILSGVANWITSRVEKTDRGYEIKAAMGIAERKEECDNAAFTNMSAMVVLRDAIAAAERLGYARNPDWTRAAARIVLPKKGSVVISHDRFKRNEDKGGTPDPLMGIFPLGFEMGEVSERATLEFYLGLRKGYIGSPMLSALYGVWAAYAGDRALSAKLLEEGYGQFCVGRFDQTLEYRPDVFPDQPKAGPFFANLGGFVSSLLMGFPGLQPQSGDVSDWPKRPVVLPESWTSIEVERVWVRGHPHRLVAKHGAGKAELTPWPEGL
ncbi:MAG: glycoside hydrolase family 65 protein [Gammaproteobacteria bacterium]|nr:glycoside hydrolase family 65 protein [Gammaproteobacteria bacterium]